MFEVHSYQQDHNCNSHKFYHGLHASHARMNVVRVEIDGTLNTTPQVITDNCVKYLTNLFGQECTMKDDIIQAQSILFNSIMASSGQHVMISLKEDIKEVEVEYVLAHLTADKSPIGMALRMSFLKPLYKSSKAL